MKQMENTTKSLYFTFSQTQRQHTASGRIVQSERGNKKHKSNKKAAKEKHITRVDRKKFMYWNDSSTVKESEESKRRNSR